MMRTSITVRPLPQVIYLLRRADDALILGHRLSEWCGRAPTLEEDLAMANVGLDLLGQARYLFAYAADVEGEDNDEDSYAFFRESHQYCNSLIVELPNGDFAKTIARLFLFAGFALLFWKANARLGDSRLAAIADRAAKESSYHLQHAKDWIVRLGGGTAESRRRLQQSIDELWPYTAEFFEQDEVDPWFIASGFGVDVGSLQEAWRDLVAESLAINGIDIPSPRISRRRRLGHHTEHLSRLLAEMQQVPRLFPGAQW